MAWCGCGRSPNPNNFHPFPGCPACIAAQLLSHADAVARDTGWASPGPKNTGQREDARRAPRHNCTGRVHGPRTARLARIWGWVGLDKLNSEEPTKSGQKGRDILIKIGDGGAPE